MQESVGLISYKLTNENNEEIDTVKANDGKVSFSVVLSIYNSLSFMDDFNVYLLVVNSIDDTTVLAQQAHIIRESSDDTFNVKFDINDDVPTTKDLNLRIAISNKKPGEMGITESIRVGTILNVKLPIEVS
ncbi:hypothetical protein AB3Q54_05835 [Ligilactobacillus agilis]|uniref:hypothetical protein n=1 Tax=Ligilactobacillus agilis TaxID=1601 RepID=UPI0034E2C60C